MERCGPVLNAVIEYVLAGEATKRHQSRWCNYDRFRYNQPVRHNKSYRIKLAAAATGQTGCGQENDLGNHYRSHKKRLFVSMKKCTTFFSAIGSHWIQINQVYCGWMIYSGNCHKIMIVSIRESLILTRHLGTQCFGLEINIGTTP